MYHLVYAWSLSEYFAWPRPRQISPQARRSRRSWVRPNKEATTPHEGKSARSRRVGKERGVCGVARLVHSIHYGPRRAPCIRSLSLPTRLTWNTQTGSHSMCGSATAERAEDGERPQRKIPAVAVILEIKDP